MAASQAGDTATVLSLMADDVIFQVPGREPFGKAAFAAMSQGMKGVRMEGSSDIRELRVLGDWAYLRNHIAITVTPPGGKPIKRAGTTLTILREGSERAMAAGARRQSAHRGEGLSSARHANRAAIPPRPISP